MTVERRDERPNRPRTLRRVPATGLLAILSLSAGAGCGQSMIRRPPPVAGQPEPNSSGRFVDDAVPVRGLSWGGPAPGNESLVSPPPIKKYPTPLLTVPTDFVAFGGSKIGSETTLVSTDTAWNGWKIPSPKRPERDYLNIASKESGIALPKRRSSVSFDDRVVAVTAPKPTAAPGSAPKAPSVIAQTTPAADSKPTTKPQTPTETVAKKVERTDCDGERYVGVGDECFGRWRREQSRPRSIRSSPRARQRASHFRNRASDVCRILPRPFRHRLLLFLRSRPKKWSPTTKSRMNPRQALPSLMQS